jgi:hypothetical protein
MIALVLFTVLCLLAFVSVCVVEVRSHRARMKFLRAGKIGSIDGRRR